LQLRWPYGGGRTCSKSPLFGSYLRKINTVKFRYTLIRFQPNWIIIWAKKPQKGHLSGKSQG